jgi:hypothetical protein
MSSKFSIARLHERLGTAGFVVACIALIAALGGTAWAAAGLTGKQKRQVKSIAKKFAGKDGKNGAPGAPGPVGPQGPAGANGTNGTDGTNGTNGKDGKSVELGNEPAGLNCEEGGTTVKVEESSETKYVCNGKEGPPGKDGSPWVPENALPENATETGTWAFGDTGTAGTNVAISFAIPLAADLPESNVHFIAPNGEESYIEGFERKQKAQSTCTGSAANPTAPSGHLCIYTAFITGSTIYGTQLVMSPSVAVEFETPFKGSAGKSGARLLFIPMESGRKGWGAWAVTG